MADLGNERAAALARLSGGTPDERLGAAEYFRAQLWDRQLLKKVYTDALRRALDDTPDIALTAARGLLAQRWRYGDMDRVLGTLEVALAREPELAATVVALARRVDEAQAVELLVPVVADWLVSPDPDARAAARTALAQVAHAGADVGEHVPALAAALEGGAAPSEAEAALELLYLGAGAGADTSAAEPVAERLLVHGADAAVRYRAARFLTVARYRRGDDAGLGALARHADAAVREGAVDGLLMMRRFDGFAARGVPLLGAALADDAGGVVFGAAQGLVLAARDGVDVGAAAEPIVAAIAADLEYRGEGRVFGLDIIASSDLRREDAVADLAEALVRSDLRHRDVTTLASRALAGARARRGAARALAALEADPAFIVEVHAARNALGLQPDGGDAS